MTIEQIDVVDFISIDEKSNEVVLSISDHLEWEGNDEHLLLFQEKLNKYLAFIESGEILESYPKAEGKNVLISLVCKFPLNEKAKKVFDSAVSIVDGAGFRLMFQQM